MKKLFVIVPIVFFTATVALAEWLVEFRDIYLDEGIEQAVIAALKEGATADEIMQGGMDLVETLGLNSQNLIKAMYCAGIRGDDIKSASDQWDISDGIIVAGFKKSQEECGDALVDTQAYTPPGVPTVSFVGPPPPGGGTSASRATF